MAENNNNEATETQATATDIFQQQKKTIDTLIDVLEQKGIQQPAETVYVQPPAGEPAKPPNYMMYIAIGFVVLFFLSK